MRGTYLSSNVFYSFFLSKLLSRQHAINVVTIFQLKQTCGFFKILFIHSFCRWVSLKYISKSEEISVFDIYIFNATFTIFTDNKP